MKKISLMVLMGFIENRGLDLLLYILINRIHIYEVAESESLQPVLLGSDAARCLERKPPLYL